MKQGTIIFDYKRILSIKSKNMFDYFWARGHGGNSFYGTPTHPVNFTRIAWQNPTVLSTAKGGRGDFECTQEVVKEDGVTVRYNSDQQYYHLIRKYYTKKYYTKILLRYKLNKHWQRIYW